MVGIINSTIQKMVLFRDAKKRIKGRQTALFQHLSGIERSHQNTQYRLKVYDNTTGSADVVN